MRPIFHLITYCSVVVTAYSHHWHAPGPNDSRAPCPMLNTLANHGYIPHNGLNVSKEQFLAAFDEAIHVDPNAIASVVDLGLTLSTTGNPNTLNLQDLAKHGAIEHDASLSRLDAALGDNLHFNPRVWAETSSKFTNSIISVQDAAAAHRYRIAQNRIENLDMTFGQKEAGFSYLETAIYMSVFGNATGTNVQRRWVKTFFEHERLPWEQGWVKATIPIVREHVDNLIAQLVADDNANNER